uniref:Uncharacterized protein n=1 Tax=Anguilla anguilla TaxID=7936 RepID=A0A0E9UIQ0_ANGAN
MLSPFQPPSFSFFYLRIDPSCGQRETPHPCSSQRTVLHTVTSMTL